MLHAVPTLTTLVLVALLGHEATPADNEPTTGYHLATPDVSLVLPEALHEVSGLTCLDSTFVACIQDEQGILFIYNADLNRLDRQRTFGTGGDYEGIARVDNTIYVLRSDGTLFEIRDYDAEVVTVHSYVTGIPASDNEGLCYDLDHKRLFIACKSKIGKGREAKDKRVIYGFDLQTKTLSRDPVLTFDLPAIERFALEHDVDVPMKTKKKGQVQEPIIKFRPSAICIHPVTKRLYLLSAVDHLLFVFDVHGNLEHMERLDAKQFNKAEGITFHENGDMLITNEGEDGRPTLLRFNYGKK